MANIKIVGVEELNANLLALKTYLPKQLGVAMRGEMDAVAQDSIKQCPYDDDNPHLDFPHLADTLQVSGPDFEGDNITVGISYGNESDETGIYAIVQHEDLSLHHTHPGTKAKYLEDPFNARAKYIPSNIIKGITLEVKGGVYSPAQTPGGATFQSFTASDVAYAMRDRYNVGQQLGRFA